MDLTVFENSMKKWLLLDTQIRLVNQKLREMRNEHGTLTKSVCEYIREHKMENRKIETSDSKIEYYEKQSHSSLSYSFLEKYLADIIPEEKTVDYIIEYLKSKRETKKTWDIKRTFKPVLLETAPTGAVSSAKSDSTMRICNTQRCKKGMKRGTAKVRESSGYDSDVE